MATTTTDTPTLEALGLSYSVRGKPLLNGVNISARPGQLVGVIGPNGAGKSTLLRALAGVIRPESGHIQLSGANARTVPPAERARAIALVPQIAPLAHGFTCLELVLMGRYPHMGRFQIEGASDEWIAREAMRQTKTEQFAERTLETLSGGERQRVFIARALAQQPRVLLLDEPTANLDILHQLRVLSLVNEWVSRGMTGIAAIHDLNLAARYCDALILLHEGRVIAEGTPEDVITSENVRLAYGVNAEIYRDPQHRLAHPKPHRPRGGRFALQERRNSHLGCSSVAPPRRRPPPRAPESPAKAGAHPPSRAPESPAPAPSFPRTRESRPHFPNQTTKRPPTT